MSTLSGLFNINNYNKDPRLLGRYNMPNYGAASVFGREATPNSLNLESTFTTYLATQGAIANIIAADTYVTIASLSGGGFLFGVISPCCDAGSTNFATFRITVDGIVYTITSPSTITGGVITSANRFMIGSFAEGQTQKTATTEVVSIGVGNFGNYSNYSASGGIVRVPTSGVIMLHNEQILKYKFPLVRFESSLLVEVKFSAYVVTAPYPRCSAQYQLDTY